jgi:hypothetical protein
MKKLLLSALALGAVVFAFSPFLGKAYRFLRVSHYLLPTVECMQSLMSALEVEMPSQVSTEKLREVGDRNGASHCHTDGWGNSFEVELAPSANPPYRIRSLGRDGKRGSCCQLIVENWDEDAVRDGGQWQQLWRISTQR